MIKMIKNIFNNLYYLNINQIINYMKIGIIGNGFVGKATFLLKCDEIDILAYDVNPECYADLTSCELEAQRSNPLAV